MRSDIVPSGRVPGLLAAAFLPVWTALAYGGIDRIQVQALTAKATYFTGEVLELFITVEEAHTLNFPTTVQTGYTLDGVYTPQFFGGAVLTERKTPHTWTMVHGWDSYKLKVGEHTWVGKVLGYGTSRPATFAVVPTPTPSGDFSLDFETLPGSSARVGHLMAYDALGVHFRTSLRSAARLQRSEKGSWVEGFDPYPIGFHVVADLDRPVFGASSRVAGGTNVRITMIAKSRLGQTVAAATSAPMDRPGDFSQTLSVRASEPISSLEWWPSQANSMAAVDDLLLITRPMVSIVVVGQTLRLTWPSLEGQTYQLWSSPDLQTWSPWGPGRPGGGVHTNDLSTVDAAARFFRVSKTE